MSKLFPYSRLVLRLGWPLMCTVASGWALATPAIKASETLAAALSVAPALSITQKPANFVGPLLPASSASEAWASGIGANVSGANSAVDVGGAPGPEEGAPKNAVLLGATLGPSSPNLPQPASNTPTTPVAVAAPASGPVAAGAANWTAGSAVSSSAATALSALATTADSVANTSSSAPPLTETGSTSLLDRLQQGVQSLAGNSAGKSKPLNTLSYSLASASDAAGGLIKRALSLLGTPYRYGGVSALTGFDCSGFILDVFAKSAEINLPRTAAEQARATEKIAKDELRPGDLVFFNTMRRAFSHVGIYVGDGKFVHSPRTGSVVRVDNLDSSYWKTRFDGARRVPGTQPISASDILYSSNLQSGLR